MAEDGAMRRRFGLPRRPPPRPGDAVTYCGAGFPGGPAAGERGEVVDVEVGRDRWVVVPPTVPDPRPFVRVLVRWDQAEQSWVGTAELRRAGQPGSDAQGDAV